MLTSVLDFNADPDPAFYLSADPDPYPGPASQTTYLISVHLTMETLNTFKSSIAKVYEQLGLNVNPLVPLPPVHPARV